MPQRSKPAKKLRLWLRFILPFPAVLNQVPLHSRPALFYETFYNVGSGAFIALFGLSLAALKSDTIFSPEATKEHLMFIAAMFGGSSLFSPLVNYLSAKIPMRLFMIYPNLMTAALLFATGAWTNPTFFAITVGSGFVIRVFSRVGEMNMFRILYPPTHRGTAVGWVKAIANFSGLVTTGLGTLWFIWQPAYYFGIYWIVGLGLALAAFSYAQISVPKKKQVAHFSGSLSYRTFWEGWCVFVGDHRFVLYQVGFWFAGFGNHMSFAYIAESLKEDVGASDWSMFWIVAVLPALLMSGSAPLWGRFLDKVNPMSGRALFNGLQCIAYGFHFYGGIRQQVWPFVVGAIIHGVSTGGSTINWLTGSLYFAKKDHISLYNSIHVAFTGLRGMIAPTVGVFLYGKTFTLGRIQVNGLRLGPGIFAISAVLSLCGAIFMIWLAKRDLRPSEEVPKISPD